MSVLLRPPADVAAGACLGLPSNCPTAPVIAARMKNQLLDNWKPNREELIASFGDAKLVKCDGKLQLRGGTMADRLEALEWMSMFLPDEVATVHRE
jgi:hypothetical protein